MRYYILFVVFVVSDNYISELALIIESKNNQVYTFNTRLYFDCFKKIPEMIHD